MNKTNPFVQAGLIGLVIFCALHVLAAMLEQITKILHAVADFIDYEVGEYLSYRAEDWLENRFGDDWIPILALIGIIAAYLGIKLSKRG